MYAVIKTGGKQYRVAAGDVIEVERIKSADDQTLTLTPVLVVTDDGKAVHGAKDLAGYPVGAKIVGEGKEDKITVFKYRNKTGYARKTGHRQKYSLIEITSIGGKAGAAKAGGAKKASAKPETAKTESAKAGAAKTEAATKAPAKKPATAKASAASGKVAKEGSDDKAPPKKAAPAKSEASKSKSTKAPANKEAGDAGDSSDGS